MITKRGRLEGIFIAVTLFFVVAAVSACSSSEKRVCQFRTGDIVQSVLDDRKGQVIRVYEYICAYDVRFAGDLESQKRSWDVDTLPYAKVFMKEFELKR